MLAPDRPKNEAERLAALASYDVLDTPAEQAFDALTKLAAQILEVPIALVSLVDVDRQWFKSRYGMEAPETPRDVSFCGHVVALDRPLIVPDAHADERFSDNPLVTGAPRVRFYAGYPLRTTEGHVLGTLCAIDERPRELEPERLAALETLANEAMAHLELRRKNRLLAEEQVRLRTVLEAAVDAILTVDESGSIQSANTAAVKLFGYSLGELLGQNVSMLMPAPFAREHDGYMRRYLTTGERRVIGIGREVLARRKDGTAFPCDLAVGEMRLGEKRLFTGILRDISLRRQAEERRAQALIDLEKSRDDLLRVLNQLQVGTLAIDGAGRVVFASQTSCLESLASSRGVGKRWEDALDIEEAVRKTIRGLLTQPEAERRRLELRLGRGDRQRWVALEIKDDPRDAAGRIFYLYDVSDLHILRERLGRERSGRMVGDSAAMREVYATIGQVAKGDWTVLIEGETGTGKDLVAQAIHQASARRGAPFIAANCAGLTESILSSQLFGHVKGAFTGAVSDREGLFEAAAGGTLFLDEIGDVALPAQSALLRALQEKEITRLGETRPRKVDVRILAATNRNLQQRVKEGLFREDLLYRIRNARVRVPPLRERREDIPLLVASFLAEERVTAGKLVTDVTPTAMRRLTHCDWPGNVRELRGAIEHAVVRCRGPRIELEDLPSEVTEVGSLPPLTVAPGGGSERDRIVAALRRTGGNRARAARILGIGRATLYRRLEELGIKAAEVDEEDAP